MFPVAEHSGGPGFQCLELEAADKGLHQARDHMDAPLFHAIVRDAKAHQHLQTEMTDYTRLEEESQ